MRHQVTLRLSPQEIATLDEAARRLRVDRAAFIRAAALGVADAVLTGRGPLVLGADAPSALRRTADRLEVS